MAKREKIDHAELIEAQREAALERAAAWAKRYPSPSRERWLEGLADAMRPLFEAAGSPLPEKLLLSFGFPSTRAMSRRRKRIGECWAKTVCEDKETPHIFLHPELPTHGKSVDESAADEVLVHELVHAAGHKGHRGGFKRCAEAVGLTGKMTSTKPTAELHKLLADLGEALGPCPHLRLKSGSNAPKSKGRMLKMTCACPDGRPIRVSRAQAERGGYVCELCNEPWILDGEPRPGTLAERKKAERLVRETRGELVPTSEIEDEINETVEYFAAARRVMRAVEAMSALSYQELELALEQLGARKPAALPRSLERTA